MKRSARLHAGRTTAVRSAALVTLLIGVGVIAWIPGCNPPNFATEADVLAILNQPRTETELAAMGDTGRRLFLRHSCNNCHVVEGPTRGAPRLADLYTTPAVLLDGSVVTPDRSYIIRSILRPQDQVVAGYPQQMTSYRHLPAQEVAALVTYLEKYSPQPDQSETGIELDSAAWGLPISQE